MRINEDYIDANYNPDDYTDEVRIEELMINPKKWTHCFSFQLITNEDFDKFRRSRFYLDTLLHQYIKNYRIDVVPYAQAVIYNKREFESPYAVDQNGYTSSYIKTVNVVFIQFNPIDKYITTKFALNLALYFQRFYPERWHYQIPRFFISIDEIYYSTYDIPYDLNRKFWPGDL